MNTLFFLLVSLLPASAEAAVNLKSQGGEVTFLAVGKPSMLKIHGKSAEPRADLKLDGTNLSGKTEIAMDSFTTGIETRDKHMKEKYLQTKEHPRATLTLKDVKVGPDFASSLSSGSKPFEGTLAFHGKELPVKGNFSAANGKVSASFPLRLSEFGVEIPQYLGVTVAENVDVEVNLPLQKE